MTILTLSNTIIAYNRRLFFFASLLRHLLVRSVKIFYDMERLKSETPLFLRTGVDRSEVKQLTSKEDFQTFKEESGISYRSYGISEGTTITIPDCPVEKMTIICFPTYHGSKNETTLVEVESERKDGSKTKTWFNLARLVDRSFVDGTYVDDFREEMDTKYSGNWERLEHLRGAKIKGSGKRKISTFKFDNARMKPAVDEDGNNIIIEQERVTYEVTLPEKKA